MFDVLLLAGVKRSVVFLVLEASSEVEHFDWWRKRKKNALFFLTNSEMTTGSLFMAALCNSHFLGHRKRMNPGIDIHYAIIVQILARGKMCLFQLKLQWQPVDAERMYMLVSSPGFFNPMRSKRRKGCFNYCFWVRGQIFTWIGLCG